MQDLRGRFWDGEKRTWALLAALFGCAACVGALVARTGGTVRVALLAMPFAAGLMVLIFYRPEIGLAILLFLTADVFYVNEAIDLRAFGGGFELRDVFLFVLWIIVLLRYRLARFSRLAGLPFARPLLFFMTGAVLSAFWALLRFSVEGIYVLQELRAVASYSTFFLVGVVVQDKRTLRFLLHSIIALACFLAVISVVQYLAGVEFAFAGGRVELGTETQGLTRVLLPSAYLVNATMILVVARLVFSPRGKGRVLLVAIAALLGASVALTLSRNLWVSDAVVLFLLFLLSDARRKWRFLFILLACGLLLYLGLGLLPPGSAGDSVVEALRSRVAVLFENERFEGGRTVGGRMAELRLAAEKILRYPVLGIGLGNSYYEDGGRIWRLSEKTPYLTRFIHNGYAWIVLKMGLPLFVLFLYLLVRIGREGFLSFRRFVDPYAKGVSAGLLLSFVGLCISAMVVPIFTRAPQVVTFSTIVGLIAVESRKLAAVPAEEGGGSA